MTILVTGGAGFIGSNFVKQWLTLENTPLINLDKLTYAGNLDSLSDVANHSNYTFIQGDIGDERLVSQLLFDYKPTAIVNFAAETHVDRSIDGPRAFVETNVVGTFHLLESIRKYWNELGSEQPRFRFLHVSTDEVYGALGLEGVFTETTAYSPNSPYSASKASADHFVKAYYHTYGLPVLITNCSNNYGPYQFPEKLIPLVILNALAGKPIPVYGDGSQVRDWLYVEDHCRAIRCVLAKGELGESYNVGGNCQRTNIEVVSAICELVDQFSNPHHKPCKSLITFVKDRPGHDYRYAIDASKTCRLGWHPHEDFKSGLEKTVKWYLENRSWIERVVGNYRLERLGLGQNN